MRIHTSRSALCVAVLVAVPFALEAQELVIPDSLPPGITEDMVWRGKTLFEGDANCSSCHGMGATGLDGPNLTDRDWWHAKGDYLTLVQQIRTGVPAAMSESGVAMPPRGGADISDEDVQAVAAYIWKISHPAARDSLPLMVTPQLVERGRRVFHGNGGCVVCHGANATGAVGPNLTDEEWLHAKGSYLAIVQRILLGVPAGMSRSGVVMEPRGGSEISFSDVHAVAAYVWALSHQDR